MTRHFIDLTDAGGDALAAMISDAPASVHTDGDSRNTTSCHTIAKQICK